MSLSKITASSKSNLLDCRTISNIIYLGDDSNVSRDNITQIPSAMLEEKKQDGIPEIKSISINDATGEKIPKWTEDYNTNLNKSTKWMKLNGISSPGIPMQVVALGGIQSTETSFNELGVLSSPIYQINDSGNASKTVVSGLTPETVQIISGAKTDAGYVGGVVFGCVTPQHFRKMVFLPEGKIYFVISSLYGAYTKNKIILFRSLDCGKTWLLALLDTSEDKRQIEPCIAVDKEATLHITWREYTSGDANRNHVKYCRYFTDIGVLSDLATVDEFTGTYNRSPNVTIKTDGLTAAITWIAQGYGTYTTGYNIVYREINYAGTMSAVAAITTNANGTNPLYIEASTEFDENGYRHIVYGAKYTGFSKYDLYYIRETSGGLQARVRLNDEDAAQVGSWSNIAIYKNSIYMAYVVEDDQDLIIKKITTGVVGSKVELDDTDIGAGGSAPQLIFTSARNLYCLYTSYSANPADYIAYRLIDRNLNLGAKTIFITAGAGRVFTAPLMCAGSTNFPWSYNSGIINQYPFACFIDMDSPGYASGIFYLMSDPKCIIGDSKSPSRINYTSYNIRGAINKTKFNSAFNPAIS